MYHLKNRSRMMSEKWWPVTKFDVGRELPHPDYVAQLEAENERLKDFAIWLTPCKDDMPEYPPYKLIGEKAMDALTQEQDDE
jgi:hypothetical protein